MKRRNFIKLSAMGTATVAVSGFENSLLGQKQSTILNFPISSAKIIFLEIVELPSSERQVIK